MEHNVGKVSTRATVMLRTSLQSEVCTQSYGAQMSQESHFGNFGTPICHLDVGLLEKHKLYYKGEGGGFPQLRVVVSFVSSSLLVFRSNIKNA
jgi:hypothetical protein